MPKEMNIERSVIINKPREQVFEFLKNTRNQEKFSVWNMGDPDKQTSTQGTDGTEGFIYSWDSKKKNVGKGHQEIKRIVPGESIQYEIRFEKPMKNIANSKFSFESVNNDQTKLTWDFAGPMKFPMSLFKKSFEKMLGNDLQKSLDNLKALLEN